MNTNNTLADTAKIKFIRTTSQNLSSINILDGQFIYVVDTKEQFMDISDSQRIRIGDEAPILTYTFNDLTALGESQADGAILNFMFAPIEENKPWYLKYRITISIDNETNSEQYADVYAAGLGKKVSYFSTNNIVNERLSAQSQCLVLCSNNVFNYLGVNVGNTYALPHNIKYEFFVTRNCNLIAYYDPIIMDSAQDFVDLSFDESGLFELNRKLKTLKIGDISYDGTKDVSVPVYQGDIEEERRIFSLWQI